MLAPDARAGLRQWEPSDYVQTDLVLHYDGIRNAGLDDSHSDDATIWKDLSPSGNDASTYVHSSASNNGAWGNKGFVFATDSYWIVDNRTTLPGDFTLQAVCVLTVISLRPGYSSRSSSLAVLRLAIAERSAPSTPSICRSRSTCAISQKFE